LPLLRIFTISAFSSLKRKSPSSMTSVPRKASSVGKIGETVDAPLAKKDLSQRAPTTELWPEVGDELTGKAAYRGGVQRLHFPPMKEGYAVRQ
jgi:hypothetical protein